MSKKLGGESKVNTEKIKREIDKNSFSGFALQYYEVKRLFMEGYEVNEISELLRIEKKDVERYKSIIEQCCD